MYHTHRSDLYPSGYLFQRNFFACYTFAVDIFLRSMASAQQ